MRQNPKIEYRAAQNRAELRAIFESAIRIFDPKNGSVERELKYANTDPYYTLEDSRACFVDGEPVSSAHILNRQIRVGSSAIQMGGISAVCTEPVHRRAGYSSEVMRDCVRRMRSRGDDLSILFTGVQSHYARVGWVMYPTYPLQLTLPEQPEIPNDGLNIETCNLEQDAQELTIIYEQFNENRTGTVVRHDKYWQHQSIWWDADTHFWVARQNGVIVAYLKASAWDVDEFGYLPDSDDAMLGLFRHLFRRAKAENVTKISADVPSAFRTMFERLGCTVQRRETNPMMMRIINLKSLFTKIVPTLEARLRQSDFSDWRGSIRIRYEAAEVTLSIRAGHIDIGDDAPSIDLSVSQQQLLKLLFGNMSGEQIAFSNNLQLDSNHLNVLDVLFPKNEFFLWSTDHF
jgi:predicted acetyltransferase